MNNLEKELYQALLLARKHLGLSFIPLEDGNFLRVTTHIDEVLNAYEDAEGGSDE